MPCEVVIDDEVQLMVGGQQFSPIQGGVQLVLFDNNFKRVVDSPVLTVRPDGSICMVR